MVWAHTSHMDKCGVDQPHGLIRQVEAWEGIIYVGGIHVRQEKSVWAINDPNLLHKLL